MLDTMSPTHRQARLTPGEKLTAGVLASHRRDHEAVALAKLLGIRYQVAADQSRAGRIALLEQIGEALKTERMRSVNKSWLYDVNRHVSLASAFVTELARIDRMQDEALAAMARDLAALAA